MNEKERHLASLEKIGLSTAEAAIYLLLVRAGAPMTASAIVTTTGVPRGSIYPTLNDLTNKGLVEAEAGYGGRLSAVPAERALPFLIQREKQELIERENLAGALANELKFEEKPIEPAPEDLIQILRSPQVVAERFDRLQLEAKRQNDSFVKAPFFCHPGNPTQKRAMQRGVHVRALYERAVLDDPAVAPYLAKWTTCGEEARIYDGELPHKLAIFDREVVLLPLIRLGQQTRTLVVKHEQLAQSLSILFDYFWGQGKPLPVPGLKRTRNIGQPRRLAEKKNGSPNGELIVDKLHDNLARPIGGHHDS